MEMLLDFPEMIFILVCVIFDGVVVSVVMSSIKPWLVLTGHSRPELLVTTQFEPLMIASIATMKANGGVIRDTIFKVLSRGSEINISQWKVD